MKVIFSFLGFVILMLVLARAGVIKGDACLSTRSAPTRTSRESASTSRPCTGPDVNCGRALTTSSRPPQLTYNLDSFYL